MTELNIVDICRNWHKCFSAAMQERAEMRKELPLSLFWDESGHSSAGLLHW